MFRKFANRFHLLKITYENGTKIRPTHINITVGVNAAEIIITFLLSSPWKS